MKNKKIISFVVVFILFVVCTNLNQSRVMADSKAQVNIEPLDWSEVTEVTILYDDGTLGEDSLIYQAIKWNIPIKFEEIAMPRYTHYNSIGWITRPAGVSLSLAPKEPYMIQKDAAWAEAKQYFQYHPFYRDEPNPTKLNSMYNQFVCHADYAYVAAQKVIWNIEPWRPDIGYWGFVKVNCNE